MRWPGQEKVFIRRMLNQLGPPQLRYGRKMSFMSRVSRRGRLQPTPEFHLLMLNFGCYCLRAHSDHLLTLYKHHWLASVHCRIRARCGQTHRRTPLEDVFLECGAWWRGYFHYDACNQFVRGIKLGIICP